MESHRDKNFYRLLRSCRLRKTGLSGHSLALAFLNSVAFEWIIFIPLADKVIIYALFFSLIFLTVPICVDILLPFLFSLRCFTS